MVALPNIEELDPHDQTAQRKPSPIVHIEDHAVQRFAERVDVHVANARPAIFHMYMIGHDATDFELHLLGMTRWPGTAYRITETCYGRYMMIVRERCILTLWKLHKWDER